MTTKNRAIAGLVLGIIAIVLSFIPIANLISIIPGIIGIVMSAKALKEIGDGSEKGMAIAGLVCSIVGVVFAVPATICGACSLCIQCAGTAATAGLAGAIADAASSMQ